MKYKHWHIICEDVVLNVYKKKNISQNSLINFLIGQYNIHVSHVDVENTRDITSTYCVCET